MTRANHSFEDSFEVRYTRVSALVVLVLSVIGVYLYAIMLISFIQHGRIGLGIAFSITGIALAAVAGQVNLEALRALFRSNPYIRIDASGVEVHRLKLKWTEIYGCRPLPPGRIALTVWRGAVPRAMLIIGEDPDEWGPISQKEREALRNTLLVPALFTQPSRNAVISEIRARIARVREP